MTATIEARDGLFQAVPLDIRDPAKLAYLLDRIVEHESQWTDFQADINDRKAIAISAFADALSPERSDTILEVWKFGGEPTVVGLIGFTDIVQHTDAQFHPVFFDGKLTNAFGKRELLLRAMDWAFQVWNLHRLSLQIPGDSLALVRFARGKLGFRFEAENRSILQERVKAHGHLYKRSNVALSPRAREAELGSRRYQAVLRKGNWLDMILLSVTREEFATYVREALCPVSSTAAPPPKPHPAI